MNNIAILASGSGTNAENIIHFFRTHDEIDVKLVLSNRPDAGVLQRAEKHGIKSDVFHRETFYQSSAVVDQLKEEGITFIILAGFLWLVPENLLRAYPGKIINIHPALLPGYGGKGMYGSKVHEAVIANGEKESGITIHYVNEQYDAGDIIFQAKCPIEKEDTPEKLAQKVHNLEYKYFPEIIEKVVLGK